MESLITSSRIHFEVIGLALDSKLLALDLGDLQAYKFSKMPCLRSKTAFFFDWLKNGPRSWPFFFLRLAGERARDLAVNLWRPCCCCFFLNTCALCSWSLAMASNIPVLGFERVGRWPRMVLCRWPWPRPRVCVLDSTSANIFLTVTSMVKD